MSSSSILFADRSGQWRDVFSPLRGITITASYSCRDRQLTGPPPRADQTYVWNSTSNFAIRPSSAWYSTAMRSSCCGCNWYTINGGEVTDSVVTVVPPWDPADPEDGVYFGTSLISRENLLLVEGYEDLGPELTADNYLLINSSFAFWFMGQVGIGYQTMIDPDDPHGPSILRPWTTKNITGGGVDRDWTGGNWTHDCGIFTAFPADRRSAAGCVKPATIVGSWSIDATNQLNPDIPPDFRLTGTFGMTISFSWAS